ncbi:MAG TPA: DUF5076 domain-containing protein [Pirellulaceae bacterium]|nr:DUF5076 domain-containing protein [Pirellulaceae bacterium]
MPQELPIPPVAIDNPSREVIRVWLAKSKIHCVLRIGLWEEHGTDERDAWGIVLADLMRHIADAHELEYGRDPQETLARIRSTFEVEVEHPTSQRRGDFLTNRARRSDEI